MGLEKETLTFIANTFRSVWGIELLRHLANHPEQAFQADELLEALRVSTVVVAQGVAALESAGLIENQANGAVRYRPETPALYDAAQRALSLYDTRPNRVRRAIVANVTPGIAAFAEAFRFGTKTDRDED